MRPARLGARIAALAGAATLVGAGVSPAVGATSYDGSATALSITGLTLDLFPELPEGAPEELENVPDIVVDDQQVGHAEFDTSRSVFEMPENPLLTATALESFSTLNDSGHIVSEASVAGLSIGGGALTADAVLARCTGDGSTITLEAPQAVLTGNSEDLGTVDIAPGTAVPVPGVGSVAFNVQDTDGTASGSVQNLVITLDTDLSLAQLQNIPEAAAAVEGVLKQVLADLRDSNPVAEPIVPGDEELEGYTLQQLYTELDTVLHELPLADLPDANALAHLSGTVVVAAAACSQQLTPDAQPAPRPGPAPDPVKNRPPVPRGGVAEPPLADTGSPVGMAAAGLGGLLALTAGGTALWRRQR